MHDFKTIDDARKYFIESVVPNLIIDEDETIETRFRDWIELNGVWIDEDQQDLKDDNYDRDTCHQQ